jgi:hypothetical protein
VFGPDRTLHARVVRHSIDYGLAGVRVFHGVPQFVWQFSYLLFVCGPLLPGRTRGDEVRWRICAFTIVGLVVVTDVVYSCAYVSAWCFFAAAASLLLAVLFARMPDGGDLGSADRRLRTPGLERI